MSPETKSFMARASTVREAAFDDYSQIAAVLLRNGLQPKSREAWEYLWRGNPAYQNLSNWPIGWVAENKKQEIVGYLGNIPLRYHFGGRELLAATGYGICADLPYRGDAGFMVKRYLRQKTLDFLVVSSANASSAKFNEAFRRPRVPAGDWSRSSFWITNYHGFVASAFKRHKWPGLLSYPASAALSLRDRLTRAQSWMRQKGCHVSTCFSFDERFDTFWEDLKQFHPNRLLNYRKRADLQWHFKYALAEKNLWVATIGDDSRLLAYGIFSRQDNPVIGLKRVGLVDFQALNNDTKLLVPLLSWALRRCQKEGIHMVEAMGFRPDKQVVIDSLFPRRRQLPSWSYFYQAFDKTLEQELHDPAVWDPSQYDGDSSL